MSARAPQLLIEAFRAIEDISAIGVMLEEDGFDQGLLRTLLGWQRTIQRWHQPSATLPDDGKPTPAAWAWLCSGWEIDVRAVADAADLTITTAAAKLRMLHGNRLIYPDGSTSVHATNAISTLIGSRLRGKGGGTEKARALQKENRELRGQVIELERQLRAKLADGN